LAIVLTIGAGFIRELPKYIGEKKYVIPFSVVSEMDWGYTFRGSKYWSSLLNYRNFLSTFI